MSIILSCNVGFLGIGVTVQPLIGSLLSRGFRLEPIKVADKEQRAYECLQEKNILDGLNVLQGIDIAVQKL